MSSPVNFIDLAAQRARLKDRLDAAVAKVLEEGKYILGPEVTELETRLKAMSGAPHAIACANGTDALALPLMAW
ncbi:MAG: DegT/DnrJ/EryC1/StrS aminotransferase family protein, partial [Oceanicaulis sp.]|nr:DegT/DnrJ/EryC1/StrS aminotransferase family protein [Oceanicaulis sp.]